MEELSTIGWFGLCGGGGTEWKGDKRTLLMVQCVCPSSQNFLLCQGGHTGGFQCHQEPAAWLLDLQAKGARGAGVWF